VGVLLIADVEQEGTTVTTCRSGMENLLQLDNISFKVLIALAIEIESVCKYLYICITLF